MSRAALVAAALAATVGIGGAQRTSMPASQPITALSPTEVLASGFRQPSAVAVEASGAVLVTDRAAGTLTRLSADGRHELLRGLRQPIGVAIDRTGGILVLEGAARRIVRLDPGGTATTVTSGLRRPRAIAVSPDGGIWVAVRPEQREDDDDRRGSGVEYVIGRIDEAGAIAPVVAGLVGVRGLAADDEVLYVAIARMVGERGTQRSRVVRIPLREDGTAGTPQPLLGGMQHLSWGLAVDALGGLFIGGVGLAERDREEDHDRDDDDDRDEDDREDAHQASGGVIRKWRAGGGVTIFARGLVHPLALAVAPTGDLLVLERRRRGRLLRFRAPSPPVPDVPEFTNQSPLTIAGRAQPADLVQLFGTAGRAAPLGETAADAGGRFTLSAPLALNAETELVFHATAAEGRGLTSSAATATVVHDDVLPRVFALEPPAGVHVRGPVVLRARGEDEGSGVADVTFLIDDVAVASVSNPTPPEALVASAMFETSGCTEGPHTLTTVAEDRAGNSRAEAQLLVVDRTPPDTVIVSGPGAETAERRVRITVGGTDVWSPVLEFSWRLDAGAWLPFGPSTVVELTGLTPGPHRFEVRARDLAGNEDATPAQQTFTVRSLRVRIVEPVDGAAISSSSVWIRGTVDGGIGETTVRMALPSGLDGTIAAPVEGGTFAMEVPADPAFATLTLLATDGSGGTAQASVSVVIAPDGTFAESLELWPPGGAAPLNVRIGLHGFSEVPLSVDIDGDGSDELTGVVGAEEFAATYTRAGVYTPVVRFGMPDGSVLVRRGVVEVYDLTPLDARLQAVWTGFRDALRIGDVEAAVRFIVVERRETWATYFRALPAEMLQQIDEIFPAISFVEVGARGAQYEMLAERDGVMVSYPVWFQIDADGRWRLWRF